MIAMGLNVQAEILKTWWLDTGKKDDILSANARILDEYVRREIKGETINSTIEGRVRLESEAKIVNSTVRGPCAIGTRTIIKNSFVGPFTSLGSGSEISNSTVEYCVVLENAVIKDVERVEESLVGRHARVVGNGRRSIKAHIGDYSEIEV